MAFSKTRKLKRQKKQAQQELHSRRQFTEQRERAEKQERRHILKQLKPYDGQRVRVQATFQRFGTKGGFEGRTAQTLLLKNIQFLDSSQRVLSTLWLNAGKRWIDLGLQPGDQVAFDVKIDILGLSHREYRANVETNVRTDLKLSNPTKIELLHRPAPVAPVVNHFKEPKPNASN